MQLDDVATAEKGAVSPRNSAQGVGSLNGSPLPSRGMLGSVLSRSSLNGGVLSRCVLGGALSVLLLAACDGGSTLFLPPDEPEQPAATPASPVDSVQGHGEAADHEPKPDEPSPTLEPPETDGAMAMLPPEVSGHGSSPDPGAPPAIPTPSGSGDDPGAAPGSSDDPDEPPPPDDPAPGEPGDPGEPDDPDPAPGDPSEPEPVEEPPDPAGPAPGDPGPASPPDGEPGADEPPANENPPGTAPPSTDPATGDSDTDNPGTTNPSSDNPGTTDPGGGIGGDVLGPQSPEIPAGLPSFHIAVIGSSTANGVGASSGDSAWASLLQSSLSGRATTPVTTSNLAVGGYTAKDLAPGSGMPGSIDDAIREKPDLILVALAGSNDLDGLITTELFVSQLVTLRETAKAAGIPTFFMGTLPKNFTPENRQLLIDFDRAMASEFGACWIPGATTPYAPCYIDVFESLADAAHGLAPEYDSGDGQHPNDAGHAVLFRAADAIVEPYVCSKTSCR